MGMGAADADEYDVLVVGGGPVGTHIAYLAGLAGKRIGIVEPRGRLLAAPTGWVSKVFREAGRELGSKDASHRADWQRVVDEFLLPTAERAFALTDRTVEQLKAVSGTCSVTIIKGKAEFSGPMQLTVTDESAETASPPVLLRASSIFLAIGSLANRLPSLPWSDPLADGFLFDSDTIMNVGRLPHHVAIQGAGVIGFEYASIFRRLGADVTIFFRESAPLDVGIGIDSSVMKAVLKRMTKVGITVLCEDGDIESIDLPPQKHGMGRITLAKSGRVIECDAFMSAIGRHGNASSLNLGAGGLAAPVRGNFVQVDPDSMRARTAQGDADFSMPVYAIGDCCLGSRITGMLLSSGQAHAEIAANHAFGLDEIHADGRLKRSSTTGFVFSEVEYPEHHAVALWTDPTIAYAGLSEQAAVAKLGAERVGTVTVHFTDTVKACVRPRGKDEFLKLVYKKDGGTLLGVCIFGSDASEIVQNVCSSINRGDTLWQVARTVQPAVTYQESLRTAAFRAIHSIQLEQEQDA
ncbi:Soluble pyridine nucleotide transhydrogenase [Porphyridium purpureum]|uniref:Soluble pyridine nucleotide transhydrogenase n=1 Tax=Porphyridium purpureum TaxID=35688 RepID=A0A5J4YLV2_PORPP|nr:Soluble pyridine nucleotide transhydrogenase [Porphyridium purpureum]|eukprot:POR5401..scf246_12